MGSYQRAGRVRFLRRKASRCTGNSPPEITCLKHPPKQGESNRLKIHSIMYLLKFLCNSRSLYADGPNVPCPVRTLRPTPRSDSMLTVLTRWWRLRPIRSSLHTTRTTPLSRPPSRVGHLLFRMPDLSRSGPFRHLLRSTHLAASQETGYHRLLRPEHSRSACFANDRLRYTGNTPVCGHDSHSLIGFTIIFK